jgi:uncharacterized protein YozE (UPF0346 family)
MFYDWLSSQHTRSDDVGKFALFVSTDKTFPRQSHRLYLLLKYCGGNAGLRRLVKRAHREWRRDERDR